MRYYVTLRVDARYTAEVEASDIEEAKVLANQEFWNANLNELETVEYEPVIIEDEEGNYLWEK